MQQVRLIHLLQQLGFNGPQRAAAVGSIIGRMAAPGSERATYRWLQQRNALGELLEVDYESMSMMQLYRASDLLGAAQKEIESHLFNRVTDLFGLEVTVTLRIPVNLSSDSGGTLPLPTRQASSRCWLEVVSLVLPREVGLTWVRRP